MKNINKIIINFPTNIGDAILALPALDRIKANFPWVEITAIVSPKTKEFLSQNNFIDKIVLFDKCWRIRKKVRFCLNLRKQFDLMVDFKNSMLPIFLRVKKHTSFIRSFPKKTHIKDKYLKLVENIAPKPAHLKSKFIVPESYEKKWGFSDREKYIFFGCFSRSHRKECPIDNLTTLIDKLKSKYRCVLLGLAQDQKKFNQSQLELEVINLVGKTDMIDVYFLLSRFAAAVVAVDSSIMHLSSYLDIPVVGLFGPTAPQRSYPWSKNSVILQNKKLDCIPCEGKKKCDDIKCMDMEPKKIISAIKKILDDE
ncbi:MAG: glycosyltransferase family 9 protein [Candidatus Omnitrophica bacterium]|nr:glycosyltransferase family 9 protein [Candidatus Omnitrophota bacterium]